MPNWIAISYDEHANIRWNERDGYEFASAMQMIPIVLAELRQLIPEYVIGFSKQGDAYVAACLIGLGGARNLYVAPNGNWIGDYVPAEIRAYPFTMIDDAEGRKLLCIDSTHLSTSSDAHPIFGDDGEVSAKITEIMSFLTEYGNNKLVTARATALLSEAGLLEPWPITVNYSEGETPATITGLYKVSEEALNQLPPETLGKLRQYGALGLAYAQIFSVARVSELTKRINYLQKQNDQKTDNLAGIFNDSDQDVLNFDAFK